MRLRFEQCLIFLELLSETQITLKVQAVETVHMNCFLQTYELSVCVSTNQSELLFIMSFLEPF